MLRVISLEASRWAGVLVMLALAGWAELAIWFQAPLAPALRIAVATVFAATFVALAFSLAFGRGLMWTAPAAVACALVLALWWSSLKPSHERDWRPDVSRLADISIQGDDVIVRNVRTFNWSGEETAQPAWADRIYALSDLRGIDLFVSTWSNDAIAHLIPSFVFGSGPPLALSLEIRRERHESFSPVAGFFKKYELALIAADESDIVKVRSNRRNETVRLYRIDVKPENAARLLTKYAALSQDILRTPRFYHSIWTNCTTTVYAMLRELGAKDFPLDYRVIVSGRTPDYLYKLGFIDNQQPFEAIRQQADITAKARAADSAPDFSSAIRR